MDENRHLSTGATELPNRRKIQAEREYCYEAGVSAFEHFVIRNSEQIIRKDIHILLQKGVKYVMIYVSYFGKTKNRRVQNVCKLQQTMETAD